MKHIKKISFLIIMMILVIGFKNSAFAGTKTTYIGISDSDGCKYKFVLSADNKKVTIYQDGDFYTSSQLKEVKTGVYKFGEATAVRLKKSSNRIKIYASNGRDGKIYFAGTYYEKSYSSTKYTGTYHGCSDYYDDYYTFKLKDGRFNIYQYGSLISNDKVERVKTGIYKIPGTYIRIKVYGPKIKIYASDGRDAKIYYSGTYYRK